jgi:alpha-ketoglutarate-dependent taurine dioxygenase
MRPILSPEYIYAHPHQEQDVILWYNRAVWHSIVRLTYHLNVRFTDI